MRNLSCDLIQTRFASETTSSPIHLNHLDKYDIIALYDVDTPAADTFTDTDVNTTANTITLTAHTFITGVKIRLTSTGTLPAPFLTATDYFIIVVDANTVSLAASLVLAQAGTAIDITDVGTVAATNTVTSTAIAGAVVKVQKSHDGLVWYDVASATANITADGSSQFTAADVAYNYVRLHTTLTAGTVTMDATMNAKGVGL